MSSNPIDKRTREYKSTLKEVEKEKSEIPFEEGQIFFDIKVVAINLDAHRPIDFITAKRDTEGGMTIGKDGRYVRTPGSGNIVRDFKSGETLWDNKVRSMTMADFQDFVNKRPRYASLA